MKLIKYSVILKRNKWLIKVLILMIKNKVVCIKVYIYLFTYLLIYFIQIFLLKIYY